jgi:hypothetical protein
MRYFKRAAAGPLWPSVFLALLLLTGCVQVTGTTGKHQAPTATATATPASPTPDPHYPTPVPVQQAWGTYKVKDIPAPLGNNDEFAFEEAATPDGRYLVGTEEPLNFTNATTPSWLCLYDVQTGQITKLVQLQNIKGQVWSAGTDGRWIVWSEVDTLGFAGWHLFVYDLQTGAVQQLAQVGPNDPNAMNTPDVAVDHGIAIWSQVTTRPSVFMDDLATGTITTLTSQGGNPIALSWPWAEYADGTGAGTQDIRNLQTGQIIKLPVHAIYLALQGTGVAYVPEDLESVQYIADFTNPASQPIYLATGPNLEFVSMSPRLVAWQEVATIDETVWDRVQHRLVELAKNVTEPGLWTGGNWFTWTTNLGSDSYTLHLVNTTTLPTSPP